MLTTWMKLEDVISEVSQYKETNTIGFHLHKVRSQILRDKLEWWLPGAGGDKGIGSYLKSREFWFCKMKKGQ